jgi:hypothetical protein
LALLLLAAFPFSGELKSSDQTRIVLLIVSDEAFGMGCLKDYTQNPHHNNRQQKVKLIHK